MKSCSLKILELFYNAKHSGRIMKPEAIGRVGEDNDGLVIELTWRVVNDIIEDAKFRAFGNPNAIAITSLMTSNIIGKSVEEAVMIDESVIKEGLDEIRPEYIEAFDMVKSAIVEAYNNYLKRNKRIVSEVITSVEEKEFDDESIVDEDLIEESLTVQQIETIVTTEKRGRGRPRKERVEPEIVGEKRGRGRPRKIVPEGETVEPTEKRGRGRPRKIVDESQVVEPTEKRGRGRPRKIVDESQILEPTEKRGRGRPRQERVEPEIVGEKRGRGRPRKIVPEGEIVEPTEKRGRGRPRKIVDESQVVEPAEKCRRGRPRKLTIETLEPIKQDEFRNYEETTKIVIPNDLDEVINDEEVDELINGKHQVQESDTFVDNLIANKPVEEDDEDMFDSDYDIFKSNIRSILSGKEKAKQEYTHSHTSSLNVNNKPVEEVKPVEINNEINEQPNISIESDANTVEVGEKRGRGRPRKVVDETQVLEPAEKRGRGRPRLNTVNSLTRSLTANGGSRYSNHDIVFASKNVTTTNININVTKTTTNVEDEKSYTDDYEKNINILSVQENSNISSPASMVEQDDEIEIEPVSTVEYNTDAPKQFNDLSDDEFDELDEDYEEVSDEDIKDEAPKGIEDLLKALLQDD